MTEQNNAKAMSEPSFAEQMLQVLPDHTHVKSVLQGWTASWSTPAGVWTVALDTPLFGIPKAMIVGVRVKMELTKPDAPQVIALLRAIGAIDRGEKRCTPSCGEGHTYEEGCELYAAGYQYLQGSGPVRNVRPTKDNPQA